METQVTAPARWTTLARTGFWMAAAAPLLMLLAGFLWGLEMGGTVVFLSLSALLAIAAGALVRLRGRWPKFVAIGCGLLVALALFWTAFGLSTPQSFFDFMPGVLVIPGVLFGIVNTIRAVGASSRGESVEPGERRASRMVLAAIGVLAVVSGVMTYGARTTVADASGASTVAMESFDFDQEEYRFEGGSKVLIRNQDPFRHTFTIERLRIDVSLTPGSEELITVPRQPGEYILYCRPHTTSPDAPKENDMAARFFVT